MRCYLLLRNNAEIGPFTFEEITKQALKTTDLIWIEGQSSTWRHPTEIEALQLFITAPVSEKGSELDCNVINTSNGIFIALPYLHNQHSNFAKQVEEPVLETRFSQPLETLQERYRKTKTRAPFSFPKTFSKPHSALWLLTVFAGLLLSAFLIKKIVDAYDENGSALTTAVPVADMDVLKSSDETLYQNALTTELVLIDTVTMKPVKRAPAKVNLKKFVQLEANDYKVGLFGGIKNLRLLLTNKSGYVLDKIKIELQYLKPNGLVLTTESLTMKQVLPKSSKSLAISSKNRGVKVACRITAIECRQNAEAMVNL